MITGGPSTTSSGGAPAGGLPTYRRATSPYLKGQIAVTRTGCAYITNSGPSTTFTSRYPFQVGPVAVADLQMYFSNWTSTDTGEAGSGAAATIQVYLEYNGVAYPVLMPNGASTIQVPNSGEIVTEPLGIELPAGAIFWVRTSWNPASSNLYPQSNTYGHAWNGISGMAATYAINNVANGTGALGSITDNTFGLYGPTAIVGTPAARVPQVALIGDSRTQGFGDATNGIGYIQTALGTNFVTVNLGVFGETGADFLASHNNRGRFIAGCDYATEAYGINDISTGGSLASVQAIRIAIWNALAQRGVQVYADTLQPETNSTDGWTTTANQTHAMTAGEELVRTEMNQWMRAGAPMLAGVAVTPGTAGAIIAGQAGHPLAGHFDSCSQLETAVFPFGGGTDSGIWKVGAGATPLTGDGVHADSAGCIPGAAAVPVALLT